MRHIDLEERHRQTLCTYIARILPGTAVWAFGSRVNGGARAGSDLDLAVFSTPEQRRELSRLREALEESNLPFRVDILEWGTLPDSFRENIRRGYSVLAE